MCERPFLELARRLSLGGELGEEYVLSRIRAMKEDATVRRIGGVFNSGALGFVSTLCVMSLPEEKIEGAVKVINQYAGVTHNYLRGHAYNIWFTAIAPSRESLDQMLAEIRQAIGEDLHSLPAIQKFKLDARFTL